MAITCRENQQNPNNMISKPKPYANLGMTVDHKFIKFKWNFRKPVLTEVKKKWPKFPSKDIGIMG